MSVSLKSKKNNRLVDPLYGFDADRIKAIIEKIELKDFEKDLMCYRWLVRVENMEKDARKSKMRHYILKIIIIVGSAIVPVLASLNNPPKATDPLDGQTILYLSTLIISMIVSISAGIHEFFSYGDRWRHYRATVENLKSEGWHYIQQTGRYRSIGNHEKAYKRFAERVESILTKERERYMTDIAKEKTNEGQPDKKAADGSTAEKKS
ncbi:MAG: DUF4231 domain-containing protein [Saprospiraceae bacterium]|nr:DUF4231 domain-containing protein [Saprospiraceae bacterium]